MQILNYQKLTATYQLSQEQILLLQASILEGEAGVNAWQKWQATVDLNHLDSASDAILSQLYSNLAANHVEHFHIARLKGIYKRHWYGNQLLLKKLQDILQALEEEEIATIILGDAAVACSYYQKSFQRPINNFQLLIRPQNGQAAIAILTKLGWQQTSNSRNVVSPDNLSLQLQDSATDTLNIQGHLFWAIPQDYTEQQLWANAVSCQIGKISSLTLGFNDALLHLCLRVFYLGKQQNLNLLADAVTMLRQTENIDWQGLVTKAQRYQTILPLRNTLTLLEQIFNTEMPDWVLPALHQMPTSRQEFLKYKVISQHKRTILKSILLRAIYAPKLITR